MHVQPSSPLAGTKNPSSMKDEGRQAFVVPPSFAARPNGHATSGRSLTGATRDAFCAAARTFPRPTPEGIPPCSAAALPPAATLCERASDVLVSIAVDDWMIAPRPGSVKGKEDFPHPRPLSPLGRGELVHNGLSRVKRSLFCIAGEAVHR